MKFTATNRKTDEQITVTADSYPEAGNKAAQKFCKSKTVTGHRATGDGDKSGVFGCYKFDEKINALNHQGLEFHLSENN